MSRKLVLPQQGETSAQTGSLAGVTNAALGCTDHKTARESINFRRRRLIRRVNTFKGTSVSFHLIHSQRDHFIPGLVSHLLKQPSRRSAADFPAFSRIKRMQISLGQLDTAARTRVRWTRFHSSLWGFRAPEVNTGGGWGVVAGETLARTYAGVHQRDKHGSGNGVAAIPMKRGGSSDHRRATNCCRSTSDLHRPASRLPTSSCNPGRRDKLNDAGGGGTTRQRPLGFQAAPAAATTAAAPAVAQQL